MNISKIDTNFAVPETVKREGLRFFDSINAPFRTYGLYRPLSDGDVYRRMPQETAEAVSPGVKILNLCTAGGRVRFRTNSPYVAIHAKMPFVCRATPVAMTGSMGFDLYETVEGVTRYAGTFRPPWPDQEAFTYDSVIDFPDNTMRDITIHFPLYSHVSKLYIGISEQARLEESAPYKHEVPIVYYGSSITQGGTASRPGNCYENIISRELDADHINLGFSGSALAEDAMAEYIKSLSMSAFVYDYDHNAPNAEHLKHTHKKMFDSIRAAQPKLPILILSAPIYNPNENWKKRKEIIKNTYGQAIAAGDKHVYFIDGRDLMLPNAKYDGTVDGCHPNDLGFRCMADNIMRVLKNVL